MLFIARVWTMDVLRTTTIADTKCDYVAIFRITQYNTIQYTITLRMKLALILSSILASASAFVPISGRKAAPTILFEEAEAEAEWKGAAAISGLTKDVSTVFALEEIAKILPHRYPFALVDKVIEYEAGKVRYVKY